MANPVSIVMSIIDLALKMKQQVETFEHNREDCCKIGELVATVRAVAEGLRKTMEEGDGGGALLGDALKALKRALKRSWDFVVACPRKNAVGRFVGADSIAEKLRRVYFDILLNLSAVVLANGAYNTSQLADINGIVAALRADVATNLETVAALPDAPLHLRQQAQERGAPDLTAEASDGCVEPEEGGGRSALAPGRRPRSSSSLSEALVRQEGGLGPSGQELYVRTRH